MSINTVAYKMGLVARASNYMLTLKYCIFKLLIKIIKDNTI